ncbi:MAG TPA: VOC family protein [Capillimicrobium sp.]|nr:VOC family protein [Capillimicrobium sp.]
MSAAAPRTDHASLAVEDLDAALRFYGDAFGYELLFRDEQDEAIAALTGVPGLRCALAQLRNPSDGSVLELVRFSDGSVRALPPAGHIAFRVDDLDAALARVQAHGARPLGTTVTFATGRAVYVREPSGSVIELYEPTEDVT